MAELFMLTPRTQSGPRSWGVHPTPPPLSWKDMIWTFWAKIQIFGVEVQICGDEIQTCSPKFKYFTPNLNKWIFVPVTSAPISSRKLPFTARLILTHPLIGISKKYKCISLDQIEHQKGYNCAITRDIVKNHVAVWGRCVVVIWGQVYNTWL